MEKIKVIHDPVGRTLTVWLDEPSRERSCEETIDEVVLMKDASGRIIGFEVLNYIPADTSPGISVETVIMPSEAV